MQTSDLIQYLQPLQQRWLSWWEQRLPREQQVLKALAAVLLLFIVYSLLWHPLMRARDDARARYLSVHQTYDWIKANAAEIEQLRRRTQQSTTASNWVMNINQSASDAGLALKGFTPQGDQSVRVDLEQQPFAAVMAWFGKLQQSGIHPSNVVISSTSEAGLVNVSVTLEGGK